MRERERENERMEKRDREREREIWGDNELHIMLSYIVN